MSADPCERQTRCFEGRSEFDEELGGDDVEWIESATAPTPQTVEVVGYTESGAVVSRLRRTPPCADGSLTHDMQGRSKCPACGWAPTLVRSVGRYEPTEEVEEP
jgi:hypothetical protein